MQGRVVVIFLLAVASATAQHDSGNIVQRVRVRVALPNGACDESMRITLAAHNGPLLEGVENSRCEVEFASVPEGSYQVNISGGDFANADANSSIFVSSGGPSNFDIQVRHTNELERSGVPASAFVSASDLAIPSRARKEFDRATELIRKQEMSEAIQKLNKAIALYPAYALAYNNLAVIYARFGDRVRENEALQKALSLNPRLAVAYVNLGRMNISTGNFSEAETALSQASAFNPADPVTLILLCYAEFMDHGFDAAIATSRKAHSLGKSHSFVHRVAARAFEQKKQSASAIAELQLYLQEEPAGPRADAARKELEIVKTVLP